MAYRACPARRGSERAEVMPARAVPLRAGTGVAFLRRRANSSGAAPAVEHNTTNRAEERRLEAGATLSQGSELESKGHWPQTRSAFQQLGQGGLVRTKFAIPTASLRLVVGCCVITT